MPLNIQEIPRQPIHAYQGYDKYMQGAPKNFDLVLLAPVTITILTQEDPAGVVIPAGYRRSGLASLPETASGMHSGTIGFMLLVLINLYGISN